MTKLGNASRVSTMQPKVECNWLQHTLQADATSIKNVHDE